MKKLLLVLMVVSMAALLFTGCFNVPVAVTGVTLDQATMTLTAEGAAGTLVATVTPATATDQSVTWSSTTPAVATVASGVVTPLTAGTTTVTVTTVDGSLTATCAVTVMPPVVPVPAEITIEVATETLPDADGKIYVKGGSREITVTFPAAVDNPVVKVGTVVVPVFTVDDKVFKGTGLFVGPCDAVLIEVSGVCEDICAAKSVVVDSEAPVISLEATVEECDCYEGYQLIITSTGPTPLCADDEDVCCGEDDCSGFESVLVEIYGGYPWEDCCEPADCLDLLGSSDSCDIPAETECIGQTIVVVGGEVTYTDFFDGVYYVVATLEDKVGNVNTYYGEVTATDEDHVSFMELVVNPTTCTPCPAEALADVDTIIGECEPPATVCYVEPPVALICPDVTPETTTVGVETTITLTFNRDVDEVVDGKIMAYISDGAKSTPPNIPDNALPLFLVQSTTDLKVFTGEVTFDTAGSKVLYVLWDCETCAPCMYEINVSAIEDCPEIAWFGDSGTVIDGVTWLKGGDTYTFTLTYDHVITDDEQKLYQVRIRDYTSIIPILPSGGLIFDDFRILADMDASAGDTVFTGTFTPPSIDDKGEYCTVAYVEVDILEDCCEPCMYKFGVDADLPGAEIEITAVDCCGFAFLEFDSVPLTCDATCCGDTCTSVVGWTIDIYDTEPIWDCCVLQTTPAPVCEHEGTECPIDVSQGTVCAGEPCCLDTGDYWIVTELVDAVGNVNNYYGKVTLTGIPGDWLLVGLEYDPWTCDLSDADDNPFDGMPGSMTNGTPAAGADSNVEIYGETCTWP